MSVFVAKKAKRTRRPLKVSLEGPSGTGKTTTALRMAFDMIRHGIGKKVVVIDSENSSAELCSGMLMDGERWDFMHIDMPADKRNPAGYAEAYEWCVSQGYDIIIFDSLSHAWHGALEQVDQMARGGDKMRAWANMSPQQRQMIQTLTDTRANCIVTMRVKTDFQEVEGANGKKRMQKVGLKADQRDNTEYEFDMVLRFETGNECHVEKVRGCQEMNGKSAVKPGPAFWKPLFDWWKSAEDAPPANSLPIGKEPESANPAEGLIKQLMTVGTAEEKATLMDAIKAQAAMGAISDADLTRLRATGFLADIRLAATEDDVAAVVATVDKTVNAGRLSAEQAEKLKGAANKRVGAIRDAAGA
jgi:hypothetical protein